VASVADRETANVGAGNWKGLGMWAWLLFRVAGVIVALYLFVHIVIISEGRLTGASTLDSILKTFDNPLFVLLDLLLVWAVLFHGLNGVRVLLMDVGVGIRSHKVVFVGAMALAVAFFVFFIVAAWPLVF
jgi:succinate dehydrogenase / fumarate reductase cytochrome b subunit